MENILETSLDYYRATVLFPRIYNILLELIHPLGKMSAYSFSSNNILPLLLHTLFLLQDPTDIFHVDAVG